MLLRSVGSFLKNQCVEVTNIYVCHYMLKPCLTFDYVTMVCSRNSVYKVRDPNPVFPITKHKSRPCCLAICLCYLYVIVFQNPLLTPVITPRFVPSVTPALLAQLGSLAEKYNIPIQVSSLKGALYSIHFLPKVNFRPTQTNKQTNKQTSSHV